MESVEIARLRRGGATQTVTPDDQRIKIYVTLAGHQSFLLCWRTASNKAI